MRAWRRMEGAARTHHEEDLLTRAQLLLVDGADTVVVVSPSGPPRQLGMVTMRGTGWQLVLFGVEGAGRERVQAQPNGVWRTTAVGRFGRFWWVRMVGTEGPVTLLASHLRVGLPSGGQLVA